jgi:hypothetical protein
MLLRFLHTHKVGGTSLRASFRARFGAQALLPWRELSEAQQELALDDPDTFQQQLEAQGAHVVTAHLTYKQWPWPAENVIVFFRDPVDRVVSHYYGRRRGAVRRAGQGLPLKKVQEEAMRLSLREWTAQAPFRNNQSKMTAGLDLDKAFVGITEHYDESVARLNERWPHLRLAPQASNVNPDKPVGTRYKIDPAFRAELERLNSEDMELYERVRKLYA